MRLASSQFVIPIAAQESVTLTASLRAAYTLEKDHGGIAKVARDVAAGSCTAIAAVIRAASSGHENDCEWIEHLGIERHGGLKRMLDRVQPPILKFLASFFASDDPKPAKGNGKSEPIAIQCEKLFEIGTGAIGWTAEATWNASPAEIMAAYRGRIALLQQIFGSSKKEGEGDQAISEPDFTRDKNAISKLKALSCP